MIYFSSWDANPYASDDYRVLRSGLSSITFAAPNNVKLSFDPLPLQAPLVMGLILGAMVEESLSQSMIILDNEWWRLFESPISLLFFALTAVSLSWPLIARRKPKSSPPAGTDEAAD